MLGHGDCAVKNARQKPARQQGLLSFDALLTAGAADTKRLGENVSMARGATPLTIKSAIVSPVMGAAEFRCDNGPWRKSNPQFHGTGRAPPDRLRRRDENR